MTKSRTYSRRQPSAPAPDQAEQGHGRRIVGIVAGVLVAIVVAFAIATQMGLGPLAKYTIDENAHIIYLNGSAPSTSEVTGTGDAETQAPAIDFTFDVASLDKIPSAQTLQTFSLSSVAAPSLSNVPYKTFEQSALSCLELGAVSVLMVNVGTGRGMSYNYGQEYYSSTTMAAIYATYICGQVFDAGRASRADGESLITQAITAADNGAYSQLRQTFDSYGWGDYAAGLGVSGMGDVSNIYPNVSAKSLAALWVSVRNYIMGAGENASWLAGVFGATSNSVLRSALGDIEGVGIMDCAGFGTTESAGVGAISDCGLVSADGSTYLVCILTSLESQQDNLSLVQTMAKDLFDLRASF